MQEGYLVVTGRPNAGKSSIIKAVIGLDVATGKRPGTTRRIAQHPLRDGLVLVDMPGFGRMMRVSKRVANKMNDRILRFVEAHAPHVALAVHVLDISTFREVTWRLDRKGFLSVDVEMVQWLAKTLGEFPLVAANKIDKGPSQAIEANLQAFRAQLHEGHPAEAAKDVYPVSAKTGDGVGALSRAIHARLAAKGYRTPFQLP
jgi:GTP-binding protein Era